MEEKYLDKTEVLAMLNNNQPRSIQQTGIKISINHPDLEYLLYYSETVEYGENIAIIVSSLPYEITCKYSYELFSWIEDINTPGAEIILSYLQKAPENLIYDEFVRAMSSSLKKKNASSLQSLRLLLSENNTLYQLFQKKNPDIFSHYLNTI